MSCAVAEQESGAAQGAVSWAERENRSALTTNTRPPAHLPACQADGEDAPDFLSEKER